MHLFLLSLPDSRTRRLSAIQKLQQSGIAFEMVDGVEATKMRLEALSFDPQALTWMKPGEIGCYFGHLRALQRLVDYGLPHACVLEDDFCFEADPEFGLLEIEQHLPQPFHFIRLQRNLSLNRNYRVISSHGPFQRVCEIEYCTVGYIIERSLAEHILAEHATCRMPIDHLYATLSHQGLFYEARKPIFGIQLGLASDTHILTPQPESFRAFEVGVHGQSEVARSSGFVASDAPVAI